MLLSTLLLMELIRCGNIQGADSQELACSLFSAIPIGQSMTSPSPSTNKYDVLKALIKPVYRFITTSNYVRIVLAITGTCLIILCAKGDGIDLGKLFAPEGHPEEREPTMTRTNAPFSAAINGDHNNTNIIKNSKVDDEIKEPTSKAEPETRPQTKLTETNAPFSAAVSGDGNSTSINVGKGN